jgi:transcriptional regulator with XRE-family HTH domain
MASTNDAHGAFAPFFDWAHYVGMNLARIRSAKGLSQRDLAEMLGVNQSTIQRAEKMHPSAKLETYQKCAEALGCELSDIFADDRAPAEIALVTAFRNVPEANRAKVFAILDLVRAEAAPQV